MFELKPISAGYAAQALQKAERYRLLNEPTAAESICLDVLEIDPDNEQALIMLVLALSDQFSRRVETAELLRRARELLARVTDEYKREYYSGMVSERRAKAQMHSGAPGSEELAYDSFQDALTHYANAERLRPPGNDESLLRWNSCVRILERSDRVRPAELREYEPSFE